MLKLKFKPRLLIYVALAIIINFGIIVVNFVMQKENVAFGLDMMAYLLILFLGILPSLFFNYVQEFKQGKILNVFLLITTVSVTYALLRFACPFSAENYSTASFISGILGCLFFTAGDEVFYRGNGRYVFEKNGKMSVFTILITSLVFALSRFSFLIIFVPKYGWTEGFLLALENFVLSFGSGLVSMCVYLKSKTLFTSFFINLGINLVSFVFSYFVVAGSEPYISYSFMYPAIIASVIFIVISILIFKFGNIIPKKEEN